MLSTSSALIREDPHISRLILKNHDNDNITKIDQLFMNRLTNDIAV